MLGSTVFQVIENWEAFNVLSPTPKKSYDTYLAPPVEEKQTENITKSPLHSEPVESPQKRRLSPDNSEFDTSYKRRRNSSLINTPRLKEILKTPLDFISRRKSVSSTVTSSLNDSTVSTMTCMDFNQSTSSLNFASTPVRANQTLTDLTKNKFDQFKSPSRLFATPKNKSFRKGFKKTLRLDKSHLKNIVEADPNCSLDDVDISICESVKNHRMGRQAECSFISVTSSTMEVEEPVQQNFRLSSTSTVPVLTLFIFTF